MTRTQSQFNLARNLSFNFFKQWTNDTCAPACPAKVPVPPPKPKYTIEKSCSESIFDTWQPTIPELLSAAKRPLAPICTPKKPCKPGMVLHKKNQKCEIDATTANECLMKLNPYWRCPPSSKQKKRIGLAPLPGATAKCKITHGRINKRPPSKKLMRQKCEKYIPEENWDHDGFLS